MTGALPDLRSDLLDAILHQPPTQVLSRNDVWALGNAVRRVRRYGYGAISFSCYSCDEAQEAHFLVPPDVPLMTPHYVRFDGVCTCIRGNS